jgi:hypothetical protein
VVAGANFGTGPFIPLIRSTPRWPAPKLDQIHDTAIEGLTFNCMVVRDGKKASDARAGPRRSDLPTVRRKGVVELLGSEHDCMMLHGDGADGLGEDHSESSTRRREGWSAGRFHTRGRHDVRSGRQPTDSCDPTSPD